jgi:hypothetical protein
MQGLYGTQAKQALEEIGRNQPSEQEQRKLRKPKRNSKNQMETDGDRVLVLAQEVTAVTGQNRM